MISKLVSLNDITVMIKKGVTPKYSETSNELTVKVINQKCVRDFQVNYDLCRNHDLTKRKVNEEKYLKKFDVLVNSTGTGTLGRVAQFISEKRVTVDSHVCIVRPNIELIDPLYFGYLLKSKQSIIQGLYTGSTGQTELDKNALSMLELQIVEDKDIQRKIGQILNFIDSKLNNNVVMNITLEKIVQRIFKSWFIDFDPVKANSEGVIFDSLSPQIQTLFPNEFEESESGVIPKGWSNKPLTDIISIQGGGTPKRSVDEYWNGYINWFSVQDTPAKGDVFVVNTKEKITQLGLDKSSTKLLARGTTIITARGTVGKLALVADPCCMNQSCYGIKGKNIGDIATYYFVNQAIEKLKSNVHGAVFDTITTETFTSCWVSKPENIILEEFEKICKPLFDKIEVNVKQNNNLAAIRDKLLPSLISGKITIKKVEELLEKVS
jgi:type I restriction enzyme S subunit